MWSSATAETALPQGEASAPLGDVTTGEMEAMTEEEAGRLLEGAAGSGEDVSGDFTMPDLSEPRVAQPGADGCESQPDPAWYEALETDRRLLARELYRLRSYEAIIAASACPCELRKPAWALIEAEHEADFAGLPLDVTSETRAELRRGATRIERDARAICRAEGNW